MTNAVRPTLVLPCKIDSAGRIKLPKSWEGVEKVWFYLALDPIRIMVTRDISYGPVGFACEHEHNVDPKQRVSVPADLRRAMSVFGGLYLESSGDANVLYIIGGPQWDNEADLNPE